MRSLPRTTVWAWERREDLREINPETTAIAYLDRTIVVAGASIRTNPRRNALLLPAGDRLILIPVVRIEAGRDADLTNENAEAVSLAIAAAAQRPGIRALQVDFDATRSQRDWYRTMLIGLRRRLPASLPLSVTALASWCSHDRWMSGLPIDEAVPMLFRMEPDRRRAASADSSMAIRDPLCLAAVGISTREPWPADTRGKRIYLFPDRGWQRDGLLQTIGELR